jgi:hypothetical protein
MNSSDIELIEAYVNGEMSFDTTDTLRLYVKPREDVIVTTPNGSRVKVTSYDGRVPSTGDAVFHGVVLKAPQCPDLVGEEIVFVIDSTGAVILMDRSDMFVSEPLHPADDVHVNR